MKNSREKQGQVVVMLPLAIAVTVSLAWVFGFGSSAPQPTLDGQAILATLAQDPKIVAMAPGSEGYKLLKLREVPGYYLRMDFTPQSNGKAIQTASTVLSQLLLDDGWIPIVRTNLVGTQLVDYRREHECARHGYFALGVKTCKTRSCEMLYVEWNDFIAIDSQT